MSLWPGDEPIEMRNSSPWTAEPLSGDHKAKRWTEKNFPSVRGTLKAMLILAYGSGLDEGLREAQEILEAR